MSSAWNCRRTLRLLMLPLLIAYLNNGCATGDTNGGSEGGLDSEFNKTDGAAATDANAPAPNADGANGLDPDLAKDTLGATDADMEPKEDVKNPTDELSLDSDTKSDSKPQAKVEETPQTQTQAQAPPQSANPFTQDVEVTNLKYLADKNGGTVVIETSAPATFRKREGTSPNQVVIEVASAKLPEKLQRPLITTDFKQPIASVYSYQDSGSTTARFIVQMRDNSTPNIQQEGRNILIAAQPIADTNTSDSGINTFTSQIGSEKSKMSTDAQDTSLRFYGKPINIEVHDESVIDVLNLISEQSGANLMVSNEIKGRITLKLKQVPWDQALILVMKSQQLGYVREGSVLRIAPLDALKSESDKAAKVVESQRDAQPLRVKIIPVSYAKVDDLAKQLKAFLSKRGLVVADNRTSSIVITDIIENIDRITNLVKALDSPPYQVLIEGKVVEASEQFSRDVGIQWGLSGQGVSVGGQTFQPNFGFNPYAPSTNNPAGAVGGFSFGNFDVIGSLSATLALYEKDSKVRVVSSPRIVTVNNEMAEISQVINIPVRALSTVPGANGGATSAPTAGFTFHPIELKLNVTPQITAESDVIMLIDLKREFAGTIPTDGSPPDINTRQAKTKVMVRNGQTAVIGGIYQSDENMADVGVPYLSNLPVFGWLFKERTRNNQKNELLLFLTPRILNAENSKPGESL